MAIKISNKSTLGKYRGIYRDTFLLRPYKNKCHSEQTKCREESKTANAKNTQHVNNREVYTDYQAVKG